MKELVSDHLLDLHILNTEDIGTDTISVFIVEDKSFRLLKQSEHGKTNSLEVIKDLTKEEVLEILTTALDNRKIEDVAAIKSKVDAQFVDVKELKSIFEKSILHHYLTILNSRIDDMLKESSGLEFYCEECMQKRGHKDLLSWCNHQKAKCHSCGHPDEISSPVLNEIIKSLPIDLNDLKIALEVFEVIWSDKVINQLFRNQTAD